MSVERNHDARQPGHSQGIEELSVATTGYANKAKTFKTIRLAGGLRQKVNRNLVPTK